MADREVGKDAFFERWQREFRQSRHPLSHALHRMVKLEELEKCSAAADYLYSRSTFKLIDDAKAISNTKTVEFPHRPVVRLSDVAAALLMRVHERGTAKNFPDHAIEERLESALKGLSTASALDRALSSRDGKASSSQINGEGWVLDENLVDTCALAAYLVERTQGTGVRPDLDDFEIALLLNPAGQRFIFEALELAVSSPPLTIGTVLREVLADRSSPDPAFWDQVLREMDEEMLHIVSQSGLETRLPDYVADRPIERLRDDLLDFRGEARAVAELVCQSKPGPPLAIGLFGDWGSGKSSFMNLLRHEIEQLTGQARMHGGATPFVRRAAHVIFNAWQYNDTQLWPALAENTFAQLRAGDAEGLSRQLSGEVLEELTRKVEGWQDTADGLALDLMQVQYQETENRDKLLAMANERDEQIRAARNEAVESVGRQLVTFSQGTRGPANDEATAAELVDATEASPDTSSAMLRDGITALWVAFKLSPKEWLIFFGVILALMLGGAAWFAVEKLLGVGTIASLLAVPLLYLPKALPLFTALQTYRAKRTQAERTYRSAERNTVLELARLQRELRQKENEIRRELSRVTQFKGRSPAQVLEFFLSEGAAVRALHDEVGIVSRVRRAFAQLNAVVTSHQDAGETPQRVVFYIDDLDRCRAEQVVRVLEAVHLLLAFDHFVVVVGVDTRWLETSLMSFYDDQLRANRDDSNDAQSAAPDPRATVRDYVEKIFQVPIQIPRLTTDEGGTFAKLVDTLSPVAASDQAQEVEGTADAIRYDDLPPIEPLDVTVPEPERFHEAVARAQLSAKEVELLKQLGPLAGRSPRAVKRLLNLYRLLRATRTGSRLTEFLEENSASGSWPDYPGVQLCLAIEVGLPAAQVHRFREAVIIAAGVEGTKPSELFAWPVRPRMPWSDGMAAFFESLSPTQPRERVGAVLRTIVERFGDSPQRLQLLRDIVVESSRFSFSPLADLPYPSAIAAQKPNRVREQRKRRPIQKVADKQAQPST